MPYLLQALHNNSTTAAASAVPVSSVTASETAEDQLDADSNVEKGASHTGVEPESLAFR